MSILRKFFSDIYVDISLYTVITVIAIQRTSASPSTYICFALLGIALFCWITARLQLGSAFSVRPQAKTIITTGLYHYIRHPIYVFSAVANICLIVLLHVWWLYMLIPVMIGVQVYRARKEETILVEKFGKAYDVYKKSTIV